VFNAGRRLVGGAGPVARPPRGDDEEHIMNLVVTAILAQQDDSPSDASDASEACGDRGAACEQMYEWTGNEAVSRIVSWLLTVPLAILIIILVAMVANWLLRRYSVRLVRRLGQETEQHSALVSDRSAERATQRAQTIGTLVRSLVTAFVFGVATILILEQLGIDALTAIASAGVLALAIGFGAQSVVADLFAGLFMLAEDQVGVGDRVDVGPVNGYVERMTLRTTVIRDPGGMVWHVPNSQIDYVANETQSWARATVVIGIAFEEDARVATQVLSDAATELAGSDEWSGVVVQAPIVQAGQELGDGVDVRVCVRVEPDKRRPFERALRVRLVEALNEAGIKMPNAALDVFVNGRQQVSRQ
jgi:small conductance mechanosensitive channel